MSCRHLDAEQVSFESRERLRGQLAYALAGQGGRGREIGRKRDQRLWRPEGDDEALSSQKAGESTKRGMRQRFVSTGALKLVLC